MVVRSSSSGVELYSWNHCANSLKLGLWRASSLYVSWMKAFPSFYMSLVSLEHKGLNKAGLWSWLTHHASELQASQLAECTKSSLFFKKSTWVTYFSHCKPEKYHFVALPMERTVSVDLKFLDYISFPSVFQVTAALLAQHCPTKLSVETAMFPFALSKHGSY